MLGQGVTTDGCLLHPLPSVFAPGKNEPQFSAAMSAMTFPKPPDRAALSMWVGVTTLLTREHQKT